MRDGHLVELLERKRVAALVLQLTSSETYWYGHRRCALLRLQLVQAKDQTLNSVIST